MEFINYNRKDVSSATTASTSIKNVRSITGLKRNLEDGKKEITFSGLGSYLEIDVKHKGTTKKVKIPFFSAFKKDKFVNTNGYAYVNPLAEKVIRKVVKGNVPTFELTDFQAAATAELNARIGALGTTPAEVAEKTRLENRRDNVIATAKKKDSDKLVRDEIKYLEDVVKRGVNLGACSNDTDRKAALVRYANQFERLMTLKAQAKKLTWSQKKGIRRFNNKHVKRIGAGLAAIAVAAGLVACRIFEFPKHAWETVEDWFNKPRVTTSQTVNPTQAPVQTPAPTVNVTKAPTATPTPTVVPTQVPTATPVAPMATSNKHSLNSEMFTTAREANYANFEFLRVFAEQYGFDYDQLIEGYTFVEHAHDLDTTGLSRSVIENHIVNARTLIALTLSTGSFDVLPLRIETQQTMQQCLNGDAAAGIRFVEQAHESGEPLIDAITIGEIESGVLYDAELLNFNQGVYYPELEEYKDAISTGSLNVAFVEPAKVLSLGTIENA